MPTSESHNAITRIAHHDVFKQQIVVILTIHLLDFTIIINRNNNAKGKDKQMREQRLGRERMDK